MYDIVAQVVEQLVPDVRDALKKRMDAGSVRLPGENTVREVFRSFERNEPFDGRASLAEIVMAGWRKLLTDGGLSAKADRDRLRVLNDLILKSIEVAEYRELTGTDAQR